MNGRPAKLASALLLVLASAIAGCTGGQTGSEAPPLQTLPASCFMDAQCAAQLEAPLALLKSPRSVHERLIGAECVASASCETLAATTCVCSIAIDGETNVSTFLLGGRDCALYGRGLDCLWPAAELPACSVGGCECVQACTHALQLRAEDDAREIHAEIVRASCEFGFCLSVVQLPGGCFGGDVLDTQRDALASEPIACSSTSPPVPGRAIRRSGGRALPPEGCDVGGRAPASALAEGGAPACFGPAGAAGGGP